jgi:hypothetical protein
VVEEVEDLQIYLDKQIKRKEQRIGADTVQKAKEHLIASKAIRDIVIPLKTS